jgi:hypothetical protein
MGGLEVRVELVLGVAAAIIVEAVGLQIDMLADIFDRAERPVPDPLPAAFVDIVAVAEDEVQLGLGRDATMGGEETLLVMLASERGEADAGDVGAGGRQGARAPDKAALTAGDEAIPIAARRLEPRDLDMDAVPSSGRATAAPLRTIVANLSSDATSQCTSTGAAGMP